MSRLVSDTTQCYIIHTPDTSQARCRLRGSVSSSGDPDIRFDSYTGGSTDGENVLRIYFDGTDFRAYGKKAGADAVSKKLGSSGSDSYSFTAKITGQSKSTNTTTTGRPNVYASSTIKFTFNTTDNSIKITNFSMSGYMDWGGITRNIDTINSKSVTLN